jgi:CBS domain containing-hemolysin-like protein
MLVAILVSILLLVLKAFFVAAEFALVASKRHRLEAIAERGSVAARAAVKGSHELSLMLAGAQLGITLCTLGLGSLAKPAVAAVIAPALSVARVPDEVSSVVAVILAVAIVVFLHMVVGEMAPKSWAIAHPERSAVLLALPFRGFAAVVRPVLALLNALANACLRLVGVQPQAELAQVHGPRELHLLLTASREHGMLAEPEHRVLAGAIALETTGVAQVMVPMDRAVTVDVGATCAAAERISQGSGRSRLVVLREHVPIGVVHVRDLVRAPRKNPIAPLVMPPMHLPAELTLLDALGRMRSARAQLALVGAPGAPVGLVAMEDLLERVLGQFDDETDPARPEAG